MAILLIASPFFGYKQKKISNGSPTTCSALRYPMHQRIPQSCSKNVIQQETEWLTKPTANIHVPIAQHKKTNDLWETSLVKLRRCLEVNNSRNCVLSTSFVYNTTQTKGPLGSKRMLTDQKWSTPSSITPCRPTWSHSTGWT